jgi:hypothetical protein
MPLTALEMEQLDLSGSHRCIQGGDSHTVEPLPDDLLKALMSIMKEDAQRMGIDLPPLD